MKFLLIVCGLLMALGAVMVSCGPQQAYCPTKNSTGVCADNSLGGSTGSGGNSDPGDATIITGTGGQ